PLRAVRARRRRRAVGDQRRRHRQARHLRLQRRQSALAGAAALAGRIDHRLARLRSESRPQQRGCRAIKVMVFTKNHDGTTIAHVVEEIKKFIAANHADGVTLRLASGNVGVMAATNEAVSEAEVKMLLAIFGALTLLCLLTFRSFRAVLCVIVPLTLVSIFCNALMASLGIGLKVATLPVVALGVGVGVDYGIYLFERIQHDMSDGMSFRDAFYEAMRQRGTAAVFTAITMSIGVFTWMMSALKFQADMGLLLAFMFLVNMLGAVCLLPALG